MMPARKSGLFLTTTRITAAQLRLSAWAFRILTGVQGLKRLFRLLSLVNSLRVGTGMARIGRTSIIRIPAQLVSIKDRDSAAMLQPTWINSSPNWPVD